MPLRTRPVALMPQTYDDDLFNESTMSFGQHLAELRVCLFRAIIGLALGVVIGVAVGKQVVQFINDPLVRALERHYLDKAKKSIKERYPWLSQELLEVVINERKIFEDVSIEPGAFWEDLRNAFPDKLGAVRIPEYRLQPADITDPVALCAQLQKAKPADGSADVKRLWGLLTADQQTLIDKISAGMTLTQRWRTRAIRQAPETSDFLGRLFSGAMSVVFTGVERHNRYCITLQQHPKSISLCRP